MFEHVKLFAKTLGLKAPSIIQAPMAGKITTPALVAAVSNEGGLGSFATGYLTQAEVRQGIQDIKTLTPNPFAVNVFIPTQKPNQLGQLKQYQDIINRYRMQLGLTPLTDLSMEGLIAEESLDELIDMVIKEKVRVLSFTFGNLPSTVIDLLKRNDVYLIGTATSLEEARELANSNIDAIVAQGYEAGGHRGSFITPTDSASIATMPLVSMMSKEIKKPIIAAGGIMNGQSIIAAMASGASAVQMGTAFLAVKESGASLLYKKTLEKRKSTLSDPTVLTKAYSGKWARGLKNSFIEEVEQQISDIPPYPIPNILSGPVRKEATTQNNADMVAMWSGQGLHLMRFDLTASLLLKNIREEIDHTLHSLSQYYLEGRAYTKEKKNMEKSITSRKDLFSKGIMAIISLSNGALYYVIAVEGGENLQSVLTKEKQPTPSEAILAISVGASLVYTMFMYRTLESLTLAVRTRSQWFYTTLAPFSALAFLTAGTSGAELLHLDHRPALAIGAALFVLRIGNAIDAAVKFPSRFSEVKSAWGIALEKKDYKELARLFTVWSCSIGYSVSTTDAIYNATQIVGKWFEIGANVSSPLGYVFSGLGAVGTLPLVLYWSHRGLRQLTYGGHINEGGVNPDPTDYYTYLGMIAVLPIVLGILGGATASSGAVFGQLGEFAEAIRIITSVMYAIFAGTPGMAYLIRHTAELLKSTFCQDAVHNYYTLPNDEEKHSDETTDLIHREPGKRKHLFFPTEAPPKAIENMKGYHQLDDFPKTK